MASNASRRGTIQRNRDRKRDRERGREGRKGRAFDTPNEPRLVRMTLRWEGREGREYLVRLLSSKNRRLDDLSSILWIFFIERHLENLSILHEYFLLLLPLPFSPSLLAKFFQLIDRFLYGIVYPLRGSNATGILYSVNVRPRTNRIYLCPTAVAFTTEDGASNCYQ